MTAAKRELIQLLIDHGVLRWGDFVLKSGRRSKYFLNLGLVADGSGLSRLARAYADKIVHDIGGSTFDVLFGPAYKGIPLAAAVAVDLAARFGINKAFAYDRKEAKDHAEGGRFVGSVLQPASRVLLIDDVLTDGATKLQAVDLLRAETGASVVGILVCVDRQEPAGAGLTQAQAFQRETAIPVYSLLTRVDLEAFVGRSLAPEPGES